MAEEFSREISYLLFLQACGYLDIKPIGRTHWAGIQAKMYTHAVVTGQMGDTTGIADCWCYRSYADAKAALDGWNGQGEPTGWIRHPPSGRRVSQSEDEIDAEGAKVGGVGVLYVRG
jgi:hypothetical protein